MAEGKSGCIKWGAIGCGALILMGLMCGVGGLAIFSMSVRSSDAFQEGMRRVQASAEAREVLGSPIEAGLLAMGSISVEGASGKASLSIPVSGPKGSGTLYVEAVKSAGEWCYDTVALAPEAGARINLLDEAR